MKRLLSCSVLLFALHMCALAQTYSLLHAFTPYPSTDGTTPVGGLLRDGAGNLYGTTDAGGTNFYYGTVFKLDSAGDETILYSFTGGSDGWGPSAGLIEDEQQNLYGTTIAGGNNSGCAGQGCGVVFKLSPGGEFSVLYTFTGGDDGAAPAGTLVRGGDGILYGTASHGGASGCDNGFGTGCGTVFRLNRDGGLAVLHSFSGNGPDGGVPLAGLILDDDRNLFGTASVGGNVSSQSCVSVGGCGTVFKFSADGRFSVFYTFQGYPTDGQNPTAGVIRDSEGVFYGTNGMGGSGDAGTIFRLSPTGEETVLYNFAAYPSPDGAGPEGLVRDAKGNLYGTAVVGGAGFVQCYGGCGTVFRLDSFGNYTVLATLGTGMAPGSVPRSGVIMDSKGNLYGTGAGQGPKLCIDCGEVFEITP